MAENNPTCNTTGDTIVELLHSLQVLWTKRNTQELQERAREGFTGLAEPLSDLLDLLAACNDGKGKGNSLGYVIASEFQEWIKERPLLQQTGLWLKKLQARVFGLISTGRTNAVDPLIEIYQLKNADRDFLLGHVSNIYLSGKYKEAATLSTKLNLQLDLDLEKMCTPLYLLNKVDLMEAYVSEYPELQRRLIEMLDQWSVPDFDLTDVARQYRDIPHIRQDMFNQKILSKLVFRLLDQYHLEPALCPNVVNLRHIGTLKYLFFKRFVEKSMTQENWSDHVQSTVGQNQFLQEQLIKLLYKHTDLETVARWALRYNLPKDSLPYGVAEMLENLHLQERLDIEEKRPDDLEERKRIYYQLPIPRENIHFLCSLDDLIDCKRAVLKPGQVVGIDMEWRPSFGTLEKSQVSLIQIAVKEHVFLLDLLQLPNEVAGGANELANFITAVFTDPAITKLGYGMAGDLNSLAPAHPSFKDLNKDVKGMLDLLAVHKLIQKCHSGRQESARTIDALPELPSSSNGRYTQPEKGLSLLVQHVLGKPVDKTQQLSDWEKRPLREEQILYAACDAYCLLEVYEALCSDPARHGLSINLADCLTGSQTLKPKQKTEKTLKSKKSKHGVQPTATDLPPQVSAQQFRVVCDNMLQGLGRYLRCLGVDVRLLENDDDHRKAAEVARQEGRVILTCGLPYQTLRSQVGEGKCFLVNGEVKAKEQAISVLKHFNIRVALSDVFSRCQVCNCNKYLKISNPKMRRLMALEGLLPPETGADLENPKSDPAGGPFTDTPSSSASESNSSSSGGLAYSPNCQWAEEQCLSPDSLELENGATLQISAIPVGLMDKVDLFYCCSQCGKVFWEGTHFQRVVSQFEEVLHDLDGKGFYEMHATEPNL
ncbi:exonuclease mut-7 homolog [Lissotriton helveticus]